MLLSFNIFSTSAREPCEPRAFFSFFFADFPDHSEIMSLVV